MDSLYCLCPRIGLVPFTTFKYFIATHSCIQRKCFGPFRLLCELHASLQLHPTAPGLLLLLQSLELTKAQYSPHITPQHVVAALRLETASRAGSGSTCILTFAGFRLSLDKDLGTSAIIDKVFQILWPCPRKVLDSVRKMRRF